MSRSFTKDPQDLLDYTFDFSEWLGTDGDTIDTQAVTVADGLTQNNVVNTTSTVTVWLSGGTLGRSYAVECEIVTSGGRRKNVEITVFIRNR